MADSKKAPEKEQLEKFKQAACELETDESEESFDRVLKKVAKAPESGVAKTKKSDGNAS